MTGIPADLQIIHVYDSEDDAGSANTAPVVVLSNNERPLGYYSLRDGQALKVTDASPAGGGSHTDQYTDVSQVEKFELTEEEYAKRQDTVRSFKERNKLGRFAPRDASEQQPPASSEQPASRIPVGSRCEVGLEEMKNRGTVRFVGPTSFGTGSGEWIGVEYDEPVGKNDGSVNGERYFSCRMKYGGFVRSEKVKVGDFPPEDLGLDDEM